MTHSPLTDKDLELIFSDRKIRFLNSKFYKGLKYIAVFFLLCLIIFLFLNYGSIQKQIQYWQMDNFSSAPTSIETQNITPTAEKPSIAQIPNDTIEISTISVTAPIIWEIPNTPNKIAEGLSQGVIQIQGTAKPGKKGNIFITGHSSNYPWAKGNYNQIFTLLDKLVIGDQIKIGYQDKIYLYTVFEKKIVMPSDTSTLNQTDDYRLTLMTCTPVGTNLKRLIITATQTYPSVK